LSSTTADGFYPACDVLNQGLPMGLENLLTNFDIGFSAHNFPNILKIT
jgi:hypothetical protein